MENSFYYFFSATPQVLGGILALFGVFVLFKIQSLTTDLISIGKELLHWLQFYSLPSESIESLDERNKVMPDISKSILTRDITYLKKSLEKIKIFKDTTSLEIRSRFDNVYLIYKKLVDRTIHSSIFTGIIIISCLLIIPFGKWIYCKPVLLFSLFFIIILSVGYILYSFYVILKSALQ